MRRQTLFVVLGGFGICCAGLTAGLLGFPSSSAASHALASRTRGSRSSTTTITVTAGKPSEFAFTLSKSSLIPVGTVTFKVTNKGLGQHTFEICKAPAATDTANKCVGTKTKTLNHGQSATITVKLAKGKYEYLCTVPGHAQLGMKGVIGVGVKVATPKVSGGGSTTTTTSKGGGGGGGQTTCVSPQSSTMTVGMFEYGFTGVPSTIHCGTITVTEVNNGQIGHNVDFNGAGNSLPIIDGGQRATQTVTLGPGVVTYQCDVPDHAGEGMQGTITVTD